MQYASSVVEMERNDPKLDVAPSIILLCDPNREFYVDRISKPTLSRVEYVIITRKEIEMIRCEIPNITVDL